MEPASDELALIRRIVDGESHLFGRLVDEHSGLVAAVVASQGVGAADIEDVTQQVFISAYRALGGFRGEAKFSSWIYRIAVNAARAQLRRGLQAAHTESVELAAESGREPVDARRGADASWVANRALCQALAQLPEAQRTSLVLYYFEELSYEEISAAMRMNLNTVRTQIRRGKQRLSQLLDPAALEV